MNKLINEIEQEKIVVIVRGVAADKLVMLVNAMYEGGIRFLELTYSADGSVSDEETASQIKILSEKFKDKMHIGAGTVLTEKQVVLTKDAGGEFIISPDTNPDVIRLTKELGMISMPGALTASEVQRAHLCGADFVKLFPVTSFGSDYVKSIKAPLSHIKLIAVGGITEENIPEYLKAGACGFGIGSNIVKKQLIDENRFDEITELAKKYVSAVK